MSSSPRPQHDNGKIECGQCLRVVVHQPRRETRAPSVDTLLRVLADLAVDIRERWPLYEATEALKANPTLRSAGGGGRGSDVPDPTHAVVASFGEYDESRAMLHELTSHARNLQRRMVSVLEDNPTLAQEAGTNMKNWRCSGQWNPTCTRLADYDRGKYKGWCSACVRGSQREEQAVREAS